MKRIPLLLLISVLAVAGCELIVDFDRTKIPSDTDASTPVVPVPGDDAAVEQPDATDDDAATPDEDAGDDASTPDAGDQDAGDQDASDDDAGGDAGTDDAGDAG